jgi:DNA-directed RNA polymerase subunit RPC12/RpoP
MPPSEAFSLDCMHCRKRLRCPADKVGKRIRCPECGSAMMADIGRKAEAEIELPEVKEVIAEEDDNIDL